MHPIRAAAFACGILCVTAALHAEDGEHTIKRSDLPPPVAATVDRESVGARVRGFSTETERGQVYYEAELLVNGRSKDLLIDSQGAVVEVEEEVALDSLPDPVRQALLTQAGKAKIVRIERVTKEGKPFAYEAQVKTGTKRSEVAVGPDGRSLASGK